MNYDKPVDTHRLLIKFINGFQNGFILDKDFTSNLQDYEKNESYFELLVSVWKYGASCGKYYRTFRNN